MARAIIIGDVHGMLPELEALKTSVAQPALFVSSRGGAPRVPETTASRSFLRLSSWVGSMSPLQPGSSMARSKARERGEVAGVRFITEIESESNEPIRYTIERDGRSTNGLKAFSGIATSRCGICYFVGIYEFSCAFLSTNDGITG